MKKQRLRAIEYIRGISMLGVIAIHTGSQYLLNPTSNIHLIALLEIFTRFSVPIFFFISAFGLFLNFDMNGRFDYIAFMKRRLKTVLVPYLFWSFLYIAYYIKFFGDTSYLNFGALCHTLFWGLASYQLYFLVILLWFYVLMPLWIYLLHRMSRKKMLALLVLQIAFDYYSSYILRPDTAYPLLNAFIEFRLNYLVLHYVFIFLLGGWCAIHFEKFSAFIAAKGNLLLSSFIATLLLMLANYYYLIYFKDYSALSGINTVHQLSPFGILYTIAASLFLFRLFTYGNFPKPLENLLSLLGKHSYFAYLVHPFVIIYAVLYTGLLGFVMTAQVTMVFYLAVVSVSVLLGIFCRRAGNFVPLLNLLTIGVAKK
jgi:peptidoglycan/LPS O-acetylase OafA/YrhL